MNAIQAENAMMVTIKSNHLENDKVTMGIFNAICNMLYTTELVEELAPALLSVFIKTGNFKANNALKASRMILGGRENERNITVQPVKTETVYRFICRAGNKRRSLE